MPLKFEVESPKTQSIDAVKALLAWKKVSCDPLPEFVKMGKEDSRMMLVLSKKKDCYYVTTSRSCSCPSSTYHPGTRCKHSRKYFPPPKKSREELEVEGEAILEAHHNTAKRLARPPESSMERDLRDSLPGWRGPDGQRANGPVDECKGTA
jgi:hypothetical protein